MQRNKIRLGIAVWAVTIYSISNVQNIIFYFAYVQN